VRKTERGTVGLFNRGQFEERKNVERARGPAGFGQTVGRTELEQFEAFNDFAFPRIDRFAA
jgi:hypothetical protein